MITVSFTVLGGVGGSFERTGTVSDLLLSIPYLLSSQLIPPLRVVNDLLMKGICDAGMSGGCTWDPFQITESDWNDLKEELAAPSSGNREFVEPPTWVDTIDDWNSWVMMFKYGFPEEFRELEREYRRLAEARAEAMAKGRGDLVEQLHLSVIEAGNRLGDFVMKHRRQSGD